MHGVIFQLLQQFIEKKLGQGAWAGVAQKAGLQFKVYLATTPYPDEEAGALLEALASKTEESMSSVVEEFGRFVVPSLITSFESFIDPQWQTLEIVEHAEKIMKSAMAAQGQKDTVLKIKCKRKSSNLLVVNYESPREMCAFVAGIIKGLANHFNETITVNEITCQITSGGACQFLVRRSRI